MSSFSLNTTLNALNTNRKVSNSESNTKSSNELETVASELNSSDSTSESENLAIKQQGTLELRDNSRTLQTFQRGISQLQAANEGAEEIKNNLQGARELAVQATENEESTPDSQDLQNRLENISDQIDQVAQETQFESDGILSNNPQELEENSNQVGLNQNQTSDSLEDFSSESLGLDSIDLGSEESAEKAIGTINGAVNQVSTLSQNLESNQEQLKSAVDVVQIERENQEAAQTKIRDAEIGQQTLDRIRVGIQSRSGESALAQADNIERSNALQLLG